MSTSIDLTPLSRQINEVGREIINNLGSQIDGVQANLGTVRNDLQLTRSELADLREEFQQFVEEAARVAAVQQSQVKIVDLKAQLDREFGHYSVVRRTSVGLLQGFDVGNISNAVATNVAEELMIQTPRYWLAPALVALAAWSHDRQDIAEKSVQEAFSRDRHKTSLFFTLVLRRQGRMSGSVRWLRHYMASLDPSALTREFAVILEASSCNAFGPEGNELLSAKLAEVVQAAPAAPGCRRGAGRALDLRTGIPPAPARQQRVPDPATPVRPVEHHPGEHGGGLGAARGFGEVPAGARPRGAATHIPGGPPG